MTVYKCRVLRKNEYRETYLKRFLKGAVKADEIFYHLYNFFVFVFLSAFVAAE